MEGDSRIHDVLSFWFGAPDEAPEKRMARWFTRDPALDAEIRTRFGDLHAEAAGGGLHFWEDRRRNLLALVIVLDQFSRNLFRDDPRAFAQDARALALVRAAVERGDDREMSWMQRYMFLMPFMHAEDVATQREGVRQFEALHAEAATAAAPEADVAACANAADFARRHAVIVERFGRFPHRNAILGRPSTPEEAEFLTQPGSAF